MSEKPYSRARAFVPGGALSVHIVQRASAVSLFSKGREGLSRASRASARYPLQSRHRGVRQEARKPEGSTRGPAQKTLPGGVGASADRRRDRAGRGRSRNALFVKIPGTGAWAPAGRRNQDSAQGKIAMESEPARPAPGKDAACAAGDRGESPKIDTDLRTIRQGRPFFKVASPRGRNPDRAPRPTSEAAPQRTQSVFRLTNSLMPAADNSRP
jgi:hypothetical protein